MCLGVSQEFGQRGDEYTITQAEFNGALGRSAAVTNAAGAAFTVDLIAVYPKAKVVLDYDKDIDVRHH
ncbi:hypothetical protein F5Y13DRAFT_185339 [Hypoxylon sp. FL1857]|nr:hypothetical protein F5Y13DRAFT_185339 [Hypoxylon sp. FL1857]